MKLKFFIIGSCHSGYMFKEKLLGKSICSNMEVVYQHQHDSFISIMSKACKIDYRGAVSKYQWDYDHFAGLVFMKDIVNNIIKTKPDYIVLDTYAEAACPVICMDHHTYVTGNYYISTSSIYDQLKAGMIINCEDPQRYVLFEKYFSEFADVIQKELPGTKMILVRTHSASELYDSVHRDLQTFHYIRKVESLNSRRDIYDEIIMKHVKDIRCLDMRDEYGVADTVINENYCYEISHNHYAVEYYRRQHQRLVNIIIADLMGGKEKTKYFNQAICIRFSDDFPLLLLVAKIYKDFFKVFIHIHSHDIGKSISIAQVERLRRIPNVFVITKNNAPKGSYNELLAWIEMFRMAFADPDIQYVHYTDGGDIPIRPIKEIYEFFEQRGNNCSFLNCHANGSRDEMDKLAPFTYHYYNFLYNADESDQLVMEMNEENIRMQKKNGICRDKIGEFTDIYKGVIGGSITREAFEYCMEYVKKHPEYMEDIKYTRLRTEFFFHTILLNATLFRKKIVTDLRGGKHDWIWDNRNHKYMDITLQKYEEMKENKSIFFIKKISSENTQVIEEVLKDIKTPYKLEMTD